MSCTHSCPHLSSIVDIPIREVLSGIQKFQCNDCDCPGPNLWLCLHRGCLRIGCSEKYNDHNTQHNKAQPLHCIHMNLSTERLWCYQCESEVYMDTQHYYDSDVETEDCTVKSRDSGHGSYNTFQSNSSEHGAILGFDRPIGLNVGMSGDTSESSDAEDGSMVPARPFGLVGLQNIGNTCYLNAALQALSNTVPLTKFFLDCPATVQIISEGRKPGLSRTYQALMRDMWLKKNGGCVTPSGILYGIRSVHAMFRGYHQHDTQEFLRNFMDQLHEELKQVCVPDSLTNDLDTFSMAIDDPVLSSSYDSSEGEYETCDSGVSERSSLSDDTERSALSNTSKRRLSRSASPTRRLRARMQTSVIESQPTTTANSVNRKQIRYRSIISDIFDGKLLSTVQCLTCNRVSSRVETFQDLSLPIPSRDHLAVIHGRNVAPGSTCAESVLPTDDSWLAWILAWLKSWFYGPTITLHDCLAAFFSTDELKGDNMYSCERCNKLRNGIKYSKVLQLPEVLCIHLKRFRHELMFSSKISSAVSFPLRGLDMRPYLHPECVSQVTNYELFSVICHHGTAGGGHYTCYALNSGQWYEFDDQCVTRVSPETVQTCEAYVLFYRKVTSDNHFVKNKVLELSELQAAEDEHFYISKQWLSRFNTCAEPGPIDNTDFLCHHGFIMPDRAAALEQLAVLVPKIVYNYLYKKFGGCPPNSASICMTCHATLRRLELEMETFIQLNLAFQKQDAPPTHLLSRMWHVQWLNYVQRKTSEPPGPIDNSKLGLDPADANEDFAKINEELWSFFYSIYGGGPEILINTTGGDGGGKEPADSDSNDVENSDSNTDTTTTTSTVMHDFVIPKLKQRDDENKVGTINKVMYNHGEPIEMNRAPPAEEDRTDKSEMTVPPEPSAEEDSADNENCTADYCTCNHVIGSDGGGSVSNTSLITEEESPAEVHVKANINVHRNRRRKRDSNNK